MKNQGLAKECTARFDSSLDHLMDGFVGQIICAASGATEVYRRIGKPDELVYRGADDMQEMQVQMMVDHHLQQLDKMIRKSMLEYIKKNKLYIKEDRPAQPKQRVLLINQPDYD